MQQFLIDLQRENFSFQCAFLQVSSSGSMEITGRGINLRVTILAQPNFVPDPYVYDFSVVKRAVEQLCKKHTEKVLLATHSKEITLSVGTEVVKAERNGVVFSVPRGEAVLVPVEKVNPEELARYLSGRLVETLGMEEMRKKGVHTMTLFVDNGEYSTGFEVRVPSERL